MSPFELVETTGAIARSFGPDIAHEVCAIYLTKRPTFTKPAIHWWRATARLFRLDQRAHKTVRRAQRYRKEMSMVQRRVLTPEQTASCWELIERVPRAVTEEIMMLEGQPGASTSWRRKHLRQRARRAAGVVTLLLLALVTPAWAVGPVLQTCTFSWGMPTVNTDGSVLTDLASFRVYLSPTSGSAGSVVGTLAAPSAIPVAGALYTLTCPVPLSFGQKYATVTALNSAGLESPRSNEFAFVFGNLPSAPAPPIGLVVAAIPAGPSLTIAPAVIHPGTSVTATVAGASGNQGDYFTLADAGAPNGVHYFYSYVGAGTFTFAALAAGNYEVRFYSAATTFLTALPFTVTP